MEVCFFHRRQAVQTCYKACVRTGPPPSCHLHSQEPVPVVLLLTWGAHSLAAEMGRDALHMGLAHVDPVCQDIHVNEGRYYALMNAPLITCAVFM